jgi:acetylornithine deacetylase/succinyl-diaminopimelate desuccinylase-like protein
MYNAGLVKVNVDFDYNKFTKEKLLWDSSKPANYQFNLESHIYDRVNYDTVDVDTLIIAENGKYKTQIPNTNEFDITFRSYRNETITDIYEYIEKEYKEYHGNRPGFFNISLSEIEIEYDTENHIPVEVKLSYYIPTIVTGSPYRHDEIKITEYKIND